VPLFTLLINCFPSCAYLPLLQPLSTALLRGSKITAVGMAALAAQIAGHIAAGVVSLPKKPPPTQVPGREEPQNHGATEVYNHKTLEADIREERIEYIKKRAARAPIDELIQMLERMMSDTQG